MQIPTVSIFIFSAGMYRERLLYRLGGFCQYKLWNFFVFHVLHVVARYIVEKNIILPVLTLCEKSFCQIDHKKHDQSRFLQLSILVFVHLIIVLKAVKLYLIKVDIYIK